MLAFFRLPIYNFLSTIFCSQCILMNSVVHEENENVETDTKEENTDLMGASSYASHFEVFQIVLCSNTHNE